MLKRKLHLHKRFISKSCIQTWLLIFSSQMQQMRLSPSVRWLHMQRGLLYSRLVLLRLVQSVLRLHRCLPISMLNWVSFCLNWCLFQNLKDNCSLNQIGLVFHRWPGGCAGSYSLYLWMPKNAWDLCNPRDPPHSLNVFLYASYKRLYLQVRNEVLMLCRLSSMISMPLNPTSPA